MFTRENPSPRYQELLALYKSAHKDGLPHIGVTAEETFDGRSLTKELPKIKDLVHRTGAATILDYGCGKALYHKARDFQLTTGETAASVQDYLGVREIALYDPGVPEYSAMPEQKFDGVISTDVLEHIPQQDIPWILEEMFSAANKFVFANVASFPAKKSFSNGENAHCTQQPPQWWGPHLVELSKRHPGKLLRFEISEVVTTPAGNQIRTTTISNIR